MIKYRLSISLGNSGKSGLLAWLNAKGYTVLGSGSGANEVWAELNAPLTEADMAVLKTELWGLLISEQA